MRALMSVKTNQKLLKNKKVIEEINRHRWIESERAGHDIGFERASTQWLDEFSKAWMQYHMPKQKASVLRSIFGKKSSPKGSSQFRVKSKKS